MIPLPHDFRDFLRLLNRYRVKYLVVGGYSVAYHGYPRYTGDLDVFVAVSPGNDLLKNKRRANRPKDRADVAVLESISPRSKPTSHRA